MKKRIAAVLLSQLALALPAQTTHRIKGVNLQPTIRAAQAGDIILVTDKAGPFTSNIVVDKPLSIHCNGMSLFPFVSTMQIHSIPRGSTLALTGIRNAPQIFMSNCSGRVLLSDLKVRTPFAHGSQISGCADVAVVDCALGWLSISNSRVTVEGCQLEGHMRNSRQLGSGRAGLYAINSLVTIVNTKVLGGYDKALLPALSVSRSWIWAHGSQFQTRPFPGTAPAVGGTGALLHDPSVTFASPGATKVDPRIARTVRRLPLLTFPQTPLGGQATATLRAAAGSPFVLFFGDPGERVKVAGIGSSLEVARPVLVQIGAMPRSGATAFSFRVPDVASLRGRLFRWQGIVQQGTVVDWSNAVTEWHH